MKQKTKFHRNNDKKSQSHRHDSGSEFKPFWTGTISFGLVNVPVELYPANRRLGIHLRMLDEDGTPLQRRYFCPEDGRDVGTEEIVRGYEITEGKYVTLEDKELDALAPDKSKDIDLARFVSLDQIPRIFFDHDYFLLPSGKSNKAYRLMSEVMEHNHLAGIATFVMRGKEYLVAISSENGLIRANTLHFPEELRSPKQIGLPQPHKADHKTLAAMEKLIDSQTADEMPIKELKDASLEKFHSIIEAKKRKHEDIIHSKEKVEDEGPEEDEMGYGETDLLQVIRKSLKKIADQNGHKSIRKKERRNHPSRKSVSRLSKLSKDQLYRIAKSKHVSHPSKLNKQQLLKSLQQA